MQMLLQWFPVLLNCSYSQLERMVKLMECMRWTLLTMV